MFAADYSNHGNSQLYFQNNTNISIRQHDKQLATQVSGTPGK